MTRRCSTRSGSTCAASCSVRWPRPRTTARPTPMSSTRCSSIVGTDGKPAKYKQFITDRFSFREVIAPLAVELAAHEDVEVGAGVHGQPGRDPGPVGLLRHDAEGRVPGRGGDVRRRGRRAPGGSVGERRTVRAEAVARARAVRPLTGTRRARARVPGPSRGEGVACRSRCGEAVASQGSTRRSARSTRQAWTPARERSSSGSSRRRASSRCRLRSRTRTRSERISSATRSRSATADEPTPSRSRARDPGRRHSAAWSTSAASHWG